jgi:hypothetical protein
MAASKVSPLTDAVTVDSMSSAADVPQVCGDEFGEPGAKICNEPDEQNPNFTGTAAPALTAFTTGVLSTGLKNPVNEQGDTVVVVTNVVATVEVDVAIVVDVDGASVVIVVNEVGGSVIGRGRSTQGSQPGSRVPHVANPPGK